jgi:hypothetical protein
MAPKIVELLDEAPRVARDHARSLRAAVDVAAERNALLGDERVFVRAAAGVVVRRGIEIAAYRRGLRVRGSP